MKSRTTKKSIKAAERAAKLEVVRMILRSDDDLKWEHSTRVKYPSMYFSELVPDEQTAITCRNKINRYLFTPQLQRLESYRFPCNHEPSQSVTGSFRVIVYLDEINLDTTPNLIRNYQTKLNAICERINTVCADMEFINFKVSLPKGERVPTIFAEIYQTDDTHDSKQLLEDVFSHLAATIGLYPGDPRYIAKQQYFLNNFTEGFDIKSIQLIKMQSTLCLALLDLFDLSDRLESIPQAKRKIIAGNVFHKATPSLPRDIGKLLAKVGLISGQTAVNLNKALFPATSEESSATSTPHSKLAWR